MQAYYNASPGGHNVSYYSILMAKKTVAYFLIYYMYCPQFHNLVTRSFLLVD
jgi:hypothetical protein